MAMFKKWWISFCQAMTLSLLLGLLVSLISVNIQVKFFYYVWCLVLTTHVFRFFTFELRLFSKHLWVRRGISICFSDVSILTLAFLFGYVSLSDKRTWMVYGITLIIVVLLEVFLYCILDKGKKQNSDAITQGLAIEHVRK